MGVPNIWHAHLGVAIYDLHYDFVASVLTSKNCIVYMSVLLIYNFQNN